MCVWGGEGVGVHVCEGYGCMCRVGVGGACVWG